MARYSNSITDVVMPLDMAFMEPPPKDDEDELDYSFEDAELTRQLRAVKRFDRVPIAIIVGGLLALVTAVLLFG